MHFHHLLNTTQEMKFYIQDLFSKCEQICSFLRKFSIEDFIFGAVLALINTIYTFLKRKKKSLFNIHPNGYMTFFDELAKQ